MVEPLKKNSYLAGLSSSCSWVDDEVFLVREVTLFKLPCSPLVHFHVLELLLESLIHLLHLRSHL